ncbi:SGNH hydrolase domain-containing protein [Glycomyces endophyticus]|uniref:SGNH hydrolase domain-containing protein n=1 Tax=Glycomyces endophyticus TaxID=480996 RepID=A0ABN2HA57_9ACTN
MPSTGPSATTAPNARTDTLVLPRLAPAPEPERWTPMGFRPDVQGLRAVAVGLVLLSHAGFPRSEGGYVGVDVFFVLSGFLITSLLVKEVFDTGTISIAGFYARRARRILPAAAVVTAATALGAWMCFPVTRLDAVLQDALAVVVYIVNYRFVAEQTEYLNADQMPSPFQQFWSLAVEEQFYVVWPLLLLVLLLCVRRDPRRLVTAAITASLLVFAATLALSVAVTAQSQPTAYYAAHTRAWELAGGALLALVLPALQKTPRALAWVLGIGGLAAILLSGFMFTDETAFPGYAALAPVLGTMAVIAAGSGPGRNPASTLLSTGPFQFVGRISYSLYLWHWPILILAPLALGVDPSLRLNLVLLAATVGVAQLSYTYIEEPVRNRRSLKRTGAGLLLGLSASVACAAAVLALVYVFPKTPDGTEPVDLTQIEPVQEYSALEQRLLDGLAVTAVPADLVPSLTGADGDRPETYADGCHLDFEVVALPSGCSYGDTASDVEVMLVGDSHAAQWFPALDALADRNGWELVSRTKSSCTPVSVRVDSTMHEGEYTECWDWKQEVFAEIDAVRPELVVYGASDKTGVTGLEGEAAAEAWGEGWAQTIERSASAQHIAVLTDTPWATGEAAPECLSLHMDAVDRCVSEDPYAVTYVDRREAGRAAQEAAGAQVVDTEQWFCLDGRCPLVVEGMAVYRDGHHVSTPYAASLAVLLGEALPNLQ